MLCSSKRGDSVLKATCDLCGKKPATPQDNIAFRDLQNTQVVVRAMSSESVISPKDGSKFTEYVFRCCTIVGSEDTSWEVRRRFSDFHRLHIHLKRKGEVTADFPAKNPFGMIGVVVRSRELALMEYLNTVLNRCNDEQCLLLSKFLRVNKHLNSNQNCGAIAAHRGQRPSESPKTGIQNGGNRRCDLRTVVGMVPSSSLRSKSHGESSAEFSRLVENELVVVPYSSSEDDNEYDKVRSTMQRPKLSHISESMTQGNGAECMFCDETEDQAASKKQEPSEKSSKAEILEKQRAFLQELRQRQQLRLNTSNSPVQHDFTADVDEVCHGAVAGVGIVFVNVEHPSKSGVTVVDEILSNTAAEADGSVTVGDLLLSVDGVPVTGLDLWSVRGMIVGPIGSAVTLQFDRPEGRLSSSSSKKYTVTLRRGVSPDDSYPEEGTEESKRAVRSALALSREQEPASRDSAAAAAGADLVQAIYGFAAQRGHELNLCPGDMVEVTRRHRSGWWEGRALHSGAAGWFPSNHVRQAVSPPSPSSSAAGKSPLSPAPPDSCPESDDCDSHGSKPLSAESSGSARLLSLRSTVHGSLSADSSGSSSEPTPRPPPPLQQQQQVHAAKSVYGGEYHAATKGFLAAAEAVAQRGGVSGGGDGGDVVGVEEVCSWLRATDMRGGMGAFSGQAGKGECTGPRRVGMR